MRRIHHRTSTSPDRVPGRRRIAAAGTGAVLDAGEGGGRGGRRCWRYARPRMTSGRSRWLTVLHPPRPPRARPAPARPAAG